MRTQNLRRILAASAFTSALALLPSSAWAVPTTLTHQGRLYDDQGEPISKTLPVRFALYDGLTTSTPIWSEEQNVTFDDGYFVATLGALVPFGAPVFDGAVRYLGVTVGSDPEMTPRAEVASVPYALVCGDVQGDIHPSSVWVNGAQVIDASGNWVGASSGPKGDKGDKGDPGPQGSQGVEGDPGATGAKGATGATGPQGPKGDTGSVDFATADARYWKLTGNAGTTAGTNFIGTTDNQPFQIQVNGSVVARFESKVQAPNIAFGTNHTVAADAYGTLIAGTHDTVNAGTSYGVIAGGYFNTVGGVEASVGGGTQNVVSGNHSVVSGGINNQVTGSWSTIGGGQSNTVTGSLSTVAGGTSNVAGGNYAFAVGRRAKADWSGCFVWGDSNDADVSCGANNRFVARASGGVIFYTNAALTSGVSLGAGSGSWTSLSDRNVKKDVAPVASREVLERLARMPMNTWRYRSEESGALHMGPMAQDFYAAYGLGDDDEHITNVDADGVALAAIQGLYGAVKEKDAQIAALSREAELLEARVQRLEQGGGGAAPLGVSPSWLALGGLGLVGWRLRRTRKGGES